MASRQSWENEKKVRLSKEALTKTDFIQGVQGCGNTFTFCHALEKKAILHLKMATVRFDLLLTVVVVLSRTLEKCRVNFKQGRGEVKNGQKF